LILWLLVHQSRGRKPWLFNKSRLRSIFVLCAFAVRPLLVACDRCSPQGGSDMAALGNAQGVGTPSHRSPERAQQPGGRHI